MLPISQWLNEKLQPHAPTSQLHASKQVFETKICIMYDFLFTEFQGNSPKSFIIQFNESIKGYDQRRAQIQDWDDFFILTPNVKHLHEIIDKMKPEELLKRKYACIQLIHQIILQMEEYKRYIGKNSSSPYEYSSSDVHSITERNVPNNAVGSEEGQILKGENLSVSTQPVNNHSFDIRAANAIETFICILFCLFKKNWTNPTICFLTLITGDISLSDTFFEKLTTIVRDIICNPRSYFKTRQQLLYLIQTFLVGRSNLNQNALVDYFNIYPVFYQPLAHAMFLPSPNTNMELKKQCITILLLLANYRKYEAENLYLGHIRRENSAKCLYYIGETLTKILQNWSEEFLRKNENVLHPSTLTYIQSHDLTDEKRLAWMHQSTGSLTTIFSNPFSYFSQILPSPHEIELQFAHLDTSTLVDILPTLLMLYELIYTNNHFTKILTGSLSKIARKEELTQENSSMNSIDHAVPDILKYFMTLCSVLFYQDHEQPLLSHLTHLAIIIWICLLESNYFLDFIFNVNLSLKVLLIHKERQKTYLHQYDGVGCMARLVYEIQFQYISHHSRKEKFPLRQMRKVFAIIHTIIGNASSREMKLDIDYVQLVSICCKILQICLELKHLHLMLQILRLLNMLLLCSGSIAPNPDAQCEIIYELARGKEVFDNLLEYITSTEFEKDIKSQDNFSLKVFESFLSNPTQVADYVSKIVESTFRSLSLGQSLRILRENLNQLPLDPIPDIETIHLSYLENPNNIQFFIQLQKMLTKSTHKKLKKIQLWFEPKLHSK